jgi:hypothetical protein
MLDPEPYIKNNGLQPMLMKLRSYSVGLKTE